MCLEHHSRERRGIYEVQFNQMRTLDIYNMNLISEFGFSQTLFELVNHVKFY